MCQQQTPRASRRRSLTFHKEVAVYHTLHAKEYSDAEVASTWYAAEEYHRMKDEINQALTKHQEEKRAGKKKTSSLTSMGLKDFTHSGLEKKRRQRFRAAQAVFQEQDLQDEFGIYDEERIAQVYRRVTFASQQTAAERGVRQGLSALSKRQQTPATTARKALQLPSPPAMSPPPLASSSSRRSKSPILAGGRRRVY